MGALGTWDLADELSARPDARRTTTIATVSRVDDDGSVWVRLPGADADTPVNGQTYVDVSPGQTVQATIEGGRCSITGNASSPAVGGGYVRQVIAPVEQKATNALEEAQRAHDAADAAENDAKRAAVAAESAEGSAADAANAATAAQGSASTAAGAASQAQSSAAQANAAASQAQADASTAATAADAAQASAAQARQDADTAKASATRANTAANDALAQLSNVQDVIGTVTWLAEHGTYEPTLDMTVDPDKTYYVRVMPMDGLLCDSSGSVLVTDAGEPIAVASVAHSDGWLYLPVAEPIDAGLPYYYELTVDEAMGHYVASHLALTDAGLWVLKDESAYRLLVSSDGVRVVDPAGHTVTTFGESVTFDSERPQYIGGEDAYIMYYDSDNDGRPDSILIDGENVRVGGAGKRLSEMLAEVGQASADASAALDSATLEITSTHGQLFKNGSESTVLKVAVFPAGGGRLDTIEDVRARFGASAYVEWRWMRNDGAWGTMVTTDPHISMGGMWLTVTPGDVDVKTTFEASLVLP